MLRINGSGHRDSIAAALELLPDWLADDLRGTHFLCGADPVFVGLHNFQDTQDGRAYRDAAHVAYSFHQPWRPASDRITTVVLPIVEEPWVVVHELGHVLDGLLVRDGHRSWCPTPEPVSWYAATNRWEAFAEAFTMAHIPGYQLADWAIERLETFKREQPELAPFFTPKGMA